MKDERVKSEDAKVRKCEKMGDERREE